ncbi:MULTISPECIES: pyridoxamine 5'-phosphate oxidase family protein [Dickeya]|uniref:pyridoxamine 5'-phosphate oxidase family protein n=1 Tax=Dickeya TaxID=204037 RepID=UPI000532BBD4|nr:MULTISPECIES: pyridoxamine 5'-phosphate oxidase family protein [Dickeya]TYL42519.1 pyridoxamine 5'-phosphate oxidase family protein [Dickeya sp. ws52]
MSNFYEQLDENLIHFIQHQKIFFVASAPNNGLINLSPKGMDTFLVIDKKNVAFMNFIGSGNETAAHLLENGRLTIMFCSFEQDPLILRLYGKGQVIYPGNPDWGQWEQRFGGARPGNRQVITLKISSVQTSCGFSVPFYEYKGERTMLLEWGIKKGFDGVRQYAIKNNTRSWDGLSTGLNEESFPSREEHE